MQVLKRVGNTAKALVEGVQFLIWIIRGGFGR